MNSDEILIKDREHNLEKLKIYLSILTPLVLVILTFVVNNTIQERGAKLKINEQILAEKQKIYAELGRRLNIFIYTLPTSATFALTHPNKLST